MKLVAILVVCASPTIDEPSPMSSPATSDASTASARPSTAAMTATEQLECDGEPSEVGFELWFTDSDTAAYVLTPDGVERWPRPADIIGCA